jgi:hypothetical protein
MTGLAGDGGIPVSFGSQRGLPVEAAHMDHGACESHGVCQMRIRTIVGIVTARGAAGAQRLAADVHRWGWTPPPMDIIIIAAIIGQPSMRGSTG